MAAVTLGRLRGEGTAVAELLIGGSSSYAGSGRANFQQQQFDIGQAQQRQAQQQGDSDKDKEDKVRAREARKYCGTMKVGPYHCDGAARVLWNERRTVLPLLLPLICCMGKDNGNYLYGRWLCSLGEDVQLGMTCISLQ